MKVIIEDNNYLEKFFNHYPKYEEALKNKIYDEALIMINDRPHKIKTVRGCKYKDQTIFEYKIIIDKSFTCRAAYIILNNEVIFFYISTTLIKAEFTKLVQSLKGVTS